MVIVQKKSNKSKMTSCSCDVILLLFKIKNSAVSTIRAGIRFVQAARPGQSAWSN